jgi:prevent-host-death family protein
MDDIFSIHAAKTHLSQLLARVEAGEVITIARGKIPIDKLVPTRDSDFDSRMPLGGREH